MSSGKPQVNSSWGTPHHYSSGLDARECAQVVTGSSDQLEPCGGSAWGWMTNDELDPVAQASTNRAMDAVKPCRKFFPPTGPISPAQLHPASGRPPKLLETSDAS